MQWTLLCITNYVILAYELVLVRNKGESIDIKNGLHEPFD